MALKEADNIKIHATAEEISLLKNINGDGVSSCIYGRMTGNCNTPRAIELISKCVDKVFISDGGNSGILTKLNGHPSDVHVPNPTARHSVYITPLERLIFFSNGGDRYGHAMAEYIKGDVRYLEALKEEL